MNDIRLLIVESDRELREQYARHFLRQGYQVTAVAHPRRALAAAHCWPFHVALVGRELPEIDGRELEQILTRTVAGLEVIVFSSDASPRPPELPPPSKTAARTASAEKLPALAK